MAIGLAELIVFWRIDADQAHPFARDLERIAVEHRGHALDPFALAARGAHADAGQVLLENVANTSATDAVDAGERPDAGPGPAGNQLHGAPFVDVGNGGQALGRIGINVDAVRGSRCRGQQRQSHRPYRERKKLHSPAVGCRSPSLSEAA